MTAIKDLFASERGFFALILVVASTVLTGLGKMTVDQWREFSLYVFGIYVGGKTITGAVGLFKGEAPTAPSATPADPAAPSTAALAVGSVATVTTPA